MDHGLTMSTPLLVWGVGIPLLHIILVCGSRIMNFCPQKSKKGCRGSDIIAFEIVSGVCVTYVAISGFMGFYDINGVMDNKAVLNDPSQKFYGRSLFVEDYLVIPMLCYQTWNLVMCFIHNEFRNAPMIGHHIVTALLSYFGLYPYAQYYALFFFGIAEVTSIPLNVIDVFKYLPHFSARYPGVYSVAKYLFVSGFFLIRIIVWPFFSYELWFGCQDLLLTNTAHSNFVVIFFLGANLFLTGLQFYWGYLIIRKATATLKKKEN